MIELRRHIPAAFFAVFVVAPVFWWIMDRSPPYVRLGGRIVPDIPRQGETVVVDWDIRTLRVCPPSRGRNLRRWIVTRSGATLEYSDARTQFGTLEQRDQRFIKRSLQLPENIETGPAEYSSEACFACNPVQYFFPICVSTPALHFEIKPRSTDGQ